MENLMLDSCVLFELKFWNNYVTTYGIDKFFKLVNQKHEEFQKIKNKITCAFPNDFLDKYNKYAFDEKVKAYKIYYSECKANVRKYELLCSDKNISISPEKKLIYKSILEDQKRILSGCIPYEEIISYVVDYNNMKNYVEAGMLFKGLYEGKYKFYINYVTYSELLNHTNGIGHSRNMFFTNSELVSLLTKTTLVTTNSKEVVNYVEKLARGYRNASKTKDMTPMSKDINSLGDWGDSKIAAVSNLSGINLVTSNGKDFIFDKRLSKKNENIRNHINYRNQKFSEFTSNATVYSVKEINDGKFEPVTRQSKKIKLVKSKKRDLMFDDTLELM